MGSNTRLRQFQEENRWEVSRNLSKTFEFEALMCAYSVRSSWIRTNDGWDVADIRQNTEKFVRSQLSEHVNRQTPVSKRSAVHDHIFSISVTGTDFFKAPRNEWRLWFVLALHLVKKTAITTPFVVVQKQCGTGTYELTLGRNEGYPTQFFDIFRPLPS